MHDNRQTLRVSRHARPARLGGAADVAAARLPEHAGSNRMTTEEVWT
jgi:hypothetical protein